MAEKILIVEDERNIASFVSMYLKNARYQVEIARDGGEALMKAENTKPDLVVLDLMLPDIDGLEVCRQIRSTSDVPILMLTARDDDIDKIVGLEVGADDYLTKPFRLAELRARIRAHLRRGPTRAGRDEAVHLVGALTVDTTARRCLLGGREVSLRAKEFDLLARLAADAGAALSRETLMSDVWDEHWSGSTKTLDVHVAALRRRLDEAATAAGAAPVRITTLRGRGYRLDGS
jgi:DNA-binding response OmpR family regulator